MNWRAVALILLGFYFVIDGIISFLLYLDQTWYEQLFRVIRTIGGILVVLLAPSTGIGPPRDAISHLLRILRKNQLGGLVESKALYIACNCQVHRAESKELDISIG